MNSAIYIDGYAKLESESLMQKGLFVAQMGSKGDAAASISDSSVNGSYAFLRGPKLKPLEYSQLFMTLSRMGVTPTTNPKEFDILSDAGQYERLISDFVPSMQSFEFVDILTAKSDLLRLADWGQAFIRSEMGSAAKSAGLDACIIREFTAEELERKLSALATAFPKAERLVVRKVEAVRQVQQQKAEGRFVVLRGCVSYMDHCELSSPADTSLFQARNEPNAIKISRLLSAGGVDGDYFLDIAEKEAGGWFVVEIKPMFNGTIRNVERLAEALR
jgi:hypothetical protein